MKTLLKPVLMAVLLAGSAVATVSPASAHDYYGGYDQSYGYHRHGDYGDRDRYRHRDHDDWRDRGYGDRYGHGDYGRSRYSDHRDWRDHRDRWGD